MADTTEDDVLVWQIPWEDEVYEWRGIHDLTVSRLRHFKRWYGPEYGKVNAFNLLFWQGDVDAVACVIWALLKERNKAPDTPNELPNFSVGAITNTTTLKGAVDPPEPDEAPATSRETEGSTETSTSSEASGSGRSPNSATSPRTK